jgi:hypothetical protein
MLILYSFLIICKVINIVLPVIFVRNLVYINVIVIKTNSIDRKYNNFINTIKFNIALVKNLYYNIHRYFIGEIDLN